MTYNIFGYTLSVAAIFVATLFRLPEDTSPLVVVGMFLFTLLFLSAGGESLVKTLNNPSRHE